MALLASYRRSWSLAVFGILFTPLIVFIHSGQLTSVRSLPAQWWQDPARRLAPYLEENYGFRNQVLQWYGLYRHALRSPSTRKIFYGKGDQLFYGAEQAVQQSTGAVFRKRDMDRFVRMAAQLNEAVASYGGRLIVGSAPNAQTALAHLLPEWASRRFGPKGLEYDYILQELREAGLSTLDLRSVLEAAQSEGRVYLQTDTHWNNRGALIAFNTAMDAAKRKDLQISPSIALGPTQEGPGGDLAGFLSLSSVLNEPFYVPWKAELLPKEELKNLQPLSGYRWNYAFETMHSGPTTLVIGDSFTAHYWRPLLAKTSRRVHWMHMNKCRFNWEQARKIGAEIVILLPTERYLGCKGSSWPKGLTRPLKVHLSDRNSD